MTPLHRHQVAWPAPAAWLRVLARTWDASARACLQHWAAHSLPLVVTRQPEPEGASAHEVALGLCAPLRWQRRRLALQMPLSELLYLDEFPTLDRIAPLVPASDRAAVRALHVALSRLGCTARVYGSHGWQALTWLDHLRPSSDLDLWIGVSDAEQADAAAAALASFRGEVRIDGELVFPGDTAVAWREWQAWRHGHARSLLIKRLHGPDAITRLQQLLPLAETPFTPYTPIAPIAAADARPCREPMAA